MMSIYFTFSSSVFFFLLFFFEMEFCCRAQAGLQIMAILLAQSPNHALTTCMHHDLQFHSLGRSGGGGVPLCVVLALMELG